MRQRERGRHVGRKGLPRRREALRPWASTWPTPAAPGAPTPTPAALEYVKGGSRASAPRRRTPTARFLATPAPPHPARRGAPAPGRGDGPPLPWQRGRRARRRRRLRDARAPGPAWAAGRSPRLACVPFGRESRASQEPRGSEPPPSVAGTQGLLALSRIPAAWVVQRVSWGRSWSPGQV